MESVEDLRVRLEAVQRAQEEEDDVLRQIEALKERQLDLQERRKRESAVTGEVLKCAMQDSLSRLETLRAIAEPLLQSGRGPVLLERVQALTLKIESMKRDLSASEKELSAVNVELKQMSDYDSEVKQHVELLKIGKVLGVDGAGAEGKQEGGDECKLCLFDGGGGEGCDEPAGEDGGGSSVRGRKRKKKSREMVEVEGAEVEPERKIETERKAQRRRKTQEKNDVNGEGISGGVYGNEEGGG